MAGAADDGSAIRARGHQEWHTKRWCLSFVLLRALPFTIVWLVVAALYGRFYDQVYPMIIVFAFLCGMRLVEEAWVRSGR